MKYRKKPVVIEAVQLRWDTWNEMCEFAPVGEGGCRGVYVDQDSPKWSEEFARGMSRIGLIIPTLEGDHLAIEGDYVIRGVKGEFYPCKPDIFEATYEPVGGGQE